MKKTLYLEEDDLRSLLKVALHQNGYIGNGEVISSMTFDIPVVSEGYGPAERNVPKFGGVEVEIMGQK